MSVSALPSLYDKYVSIEFAGEHFASRFSCLNRFSFIMAKWAGRFDGQLDLESLDERPGVIEYFIRQSISCDGKVYPFCFAYVCWYQYHPERFHYGKDTEGLSPQIWCANLFESLGPASFLSSVFLASLWQVTIELAEKMC